MLKIFFFKNKKRILIITIIAVFVYMFFLPYIKAEYYTNKYGKQFKDLYSLTGMVEDVEFYRVIEYSETSAKIYYAEIGGEATYFLWFFRGNKDNAWELNHYKTIWSKYGSADDLPWPFYFKEQIFY